MFRKKPEREQTRIEKRVSRISTPDLMAWADQTLNSLGRELAMYQRSQDVSYLVDAESAAEAMLAVVREIKARNQI